MFRLLTIAIFRLYMNPQKVVIPDLIWAKRIHVQPEDGYCQEPKHVVVPQVVNVSTPLASNKISCVRQEHTLFSISLLNTKRMTNLMSIRVSSTLIMLVASQRRYMINTICCIKSKLPLGDEQLFCSKHLENRLFE